MRGGHPIKEEHFVRRGRSGKRTGASDAGTICGVGYAMPIDLWHNIIGEHMYTTLHGRRPPPPAFPLETRQHFSRGHAAEFYARPILQQLLPEYDLRDGGCWAADGEEEYAIAQPDACLYAKGTDRLEAIAEFKAPRFGVPQFTDSRFPAHNKSMLGYTCQMHRQMALCNVRKAYFLAFTLPDALENPLVASATYKPNEHGRVDLGPVGEVSCALFHFSDTWWDEWQEPLETKFMASLKSETVPDWDFPSPPVHALRLEDLTDRVLQLDPNTVLQSKS